MEDNTDSVTPGLFMLHDLGDLNIRRRPEEGYFKRHPSRLASLYMKPLILNIEGLTKYYKHEEESYHEALFLFEKALELDPESLNTLANCAYVYEKKRKCESKANDARQKIKKIVTGNYSAVAQARCLAEQGRIFFKDGGTVKIPPFDLMKHALTIAETVEDKLPQDEVAYWKFVYASYLCKRGKSDGAEDAIVSLLKQAFALLFDIASSTTSVTLKAHALRKIGFQLSVYQYTTDEQPYMQALSEVIQENGIQNHSLDPLEYLSKAYELDPKNPQIAWSLAMHFTKHKQFSPAYEVIEEAIHTLQPEEMYFRIIGTRGALHLKKYEQFHQNRTTPGGKYLLLEAKKDLLQVLKYEPTPHACSQLGGICHWLLMHDRPTSPDVEREKEALSYYQAAVECVTGERNLQIHLYHAKCLADFGYMRQAVESAKRPVENDNRLRPSTYFMYILMQMLFDTYRQEKRARFIMGEMVYWMNFLCKKYHSVNDQLTKTFNQLYFKDRSVMTELYHNLLENQHEETAKLFPRYIQRFSTWCPFKPNPYAVHPASDTRCNLDKPYDFLVVCTDAQKPWVFYSLLTKLELLHGFKGCVLGRDFLTTGSENTPQEKAADTNLPLQSTKPAKIQQEDGVAPQESEEDIMLGIFVNCACIIMVETDDLYQSLWLRSSKLKERLGEYAAPKTGLIRLVLEELSDDNKKLGILPEDDQGDNCFDLTDHYVPWEFIIHQVRKCCENEAGENGVKTISGQKPSITRQLILAKLDIETLYLGM